MIDLGFGHPLPLFLAVLGAVDLIATPAFLVLYLREALGPHDSDQHLAAPPTLQSPSEDPS